MRLGILVSGRGSNLEAVLRAVDDGSLAAVQPVIVISNRPGVRALGVAEAHGVPGLVLERAGFPDAGTRDAAIAGALAAAGAELALLAGYDQLLRGPYFAAFAAPTINIHPSLLPRHGGRGMMGHAVHAAVLAAGDRVTGVTIHRVSPELDAGEVIAQARTDVRPGEEPEQLADRVLAIEHELIVRVLRDLATEMAATGASGSMTGAPRPALRHAAAKQRTSFDA